MIFNWFRNKFTSVLLIILILLSAICYVLYKRVSTLSNQVQDYTSALDQNKSTTFKDKQGRNHTKSDVIFTQDRDAFKAILRMDSILNRLNNKVRHIASTSYNITSTRKEFFTTIKDSIVNDTIRIGVIDWQDSSNQSSFKGVIKGNVLRGEFIASDTIDENITWQRSKKFLFIRYGKKKYSSEIRHSNPAIKTIFHKIAVRKG